MGLNITEAELLEVILPQTSYIVRAGVNDKFDYKIGACALITYTIPPGCYTVQSLLANIATGTTRTCTYSNDNFKVTISNAAAFSFMFATNVNSSVRSLLGFDATDILGVVTTTGSNIANLYQPLSLLLRIYELGTTNVLCSKGFFSLASFNF